MPRGHVDVGTQIAVADERHDVWQLLRLWNFARAPRAFAICPPRDARLVLTPTSFLTALR